MVVEAAEEVQVGVVAVAVALILAMLQEEEEEDTEADTEEIVAVVLLRIKQYERCFSMNPRLTALESEGWKAYDRSLAGVA